MKIKLRYALEFLWFYFMFFIGIWFIVPFVFIGAVIMYRYDSQNLKKTSGAPENKNLKKRV